MLEALAAGTAVGVISAGAQWLGSEAARKATAKERARVQELIDKLQNPNFDTRLILPEEYAVVEKYIPEVAEYVAEVAPQTVQAASEGAVKGRDAQMAALDRLRNLSVTGEDTQSRILQDQALQAAAQQNQGQQEAIRQGMARRGMSGSGMDLVQQMLAQQQSNQAAQGGAQNAALAAYNNRLQALRDSASLGGDIRESDINLEGRNVGIINDFNQRQAQRRQDYLNRSADTRNQASRYNIGEKQRIADTNISGKNKAYLDQRDLVNQQNTANYNHQMNKANLQIGQAAQNQQAIMQAAQDRNAAMSGVANILGSAGSAYQQNQLADKTGRAKYGTAAWDGKQSGPSMTMNRLDDNEELYS